MSISYRPKSEILDVKNKFLGVKNEILDAKSEILGVKNKFLGVKNEILDAKSEILGVKNEIFKKLDFNSYCI